jgi:hypothetical protein
MQRLSLPCSLTRIQSWWFIDARSRQRRGIFPRQTSKRIFSILKDISLKSKRSHWFGSLLECQKVFLEYSKMLDKSHIWLTDEALKVICPLLRGFWLLHYWRRDLKNSTEREESNRLILWFSFWKVCVWWMIFLFSLLSFVISFYKFWCSSLIWFTEAIKLRICFDECWFWRTVRLSDLRRKESDWIIEGFN